MKLGRPALEETAAKLAIAAVSLLIFFAVGEVAVRIYARSHAIYNVEMSRYARWLKIESDNPRIGHVHKPNARARLMNVMVEINSDGFRDDEVPVERSDMARIIFLGDSLTFGWGVEKGETFEDLLEHRLNGRVPTEIINFGTGNYNTEQEVHLFLEKGLKYRPDAVIVFYFINDAEPTPMPSRWSVLESSDLVTFSWSKILALRHTLDRSRGYLEYYKSLYEDDQPGWAAAKQALRLLNDVCQRHSMALKVVLLVELHDLADYPFAAEHARLARFLGAEGIPVLDLAPLFRGQNAARLWVASDDAHPNAIAHRMIASHVADFIAPHGD